MKKLHLIILASLLIPGLAQCKKPIDPPSQDESEKVSITLILNGGTKDDGTKVDITPGEQTAVVTYTEGDKIIVAYNGKYVGMLSYDHGAFTNNALSITRSDTDQPLYFYFVGNRGNEESLTAGTTQSFSIDISDQSETYAVLSYAASNEIFTGSGTYTAHLLNQSGFVKFNTPALDQTLTNGVFAIIGMNNMVTVDFTNHDQPFSSTMDGDGRIFLKAENSEGTECWAVLPMTDAAITTVAVADGYINSTSFTVPMITANLYYKRGVDVSGMVEKSSIIDGKFTVDSDGKQVYFSRGNLQYVRVINLNPITPPGPINPGKFSGGSLRFANNQYDYMGDNNARGNVTIPANLLHGGYNNVSDLIPHYGARDLFGWGTSGYEGVEPYTFVENNSNYAYPGSMTSIAGTNYDWGVYNNYNGTNRILQGGTYAWRTLTSAEWSYMLNRTKTVAVDYGDNHTPEVGLWTLGQVMGVKGLLLFPDDWTGELDKTILYTQMMTFNSNVYTASSSPTWEQMEAAGVVFLPCAGYRDSQGVHNQSSNNTSMCGYYWSTTHNGPEDAKLLVFNHNSYDAEYQSYRYLGHAVRLVFDATAE